MTLTMMTQLTLRWSLAGDDPATVYDAVAPAGAPVIHDIVDPAIPVAPASPGDANRMVPVADASKYDGDPGMPTAGLR